MAVVRAIRRYLWRILFATDVWLNTALGGDDDMTISLRTARAARAGSRWGKAGCWLLDKFDPGHCAAARRTDEGQEAS